MAAPDMDVIKEIPGYKVILKAVLKSQIQQLVEQLASSTDEESVILTASVADGTLCHLGSNSGKVFLEDHEDIKSQFLGFCLKRHHKQKQEKEKQEALEREEALARSMAPTTPPRYGGMGPRPGYASQRSPRYSAPHPITLTRASPNAGLRAQGARHHPYQANRPARPRLSLDQQNWSAGPGQGPGPIKMPEGQVIKIEPDDDNDENADKVQTGTGADTSQPSSPSVKPNTPSSTQGPGASDNDDAKSESSSSTIPNEALDKINDNIPTAGLSLDSDLSNLIKASTSDTDPNASQSSVTQDSNSAPQTPVQYDPNIGVKLEAVTDAEMDLEITGVELGQRPVQEPVGSPNWMPNISMQGASGSTADMSGYNNPTGINRDGRRKGNKSPSQGQMALQCVDCGMQFKFRSQLEIHRRIHTGVKPYVCNVCNKRFAQKNNLKSHMAVHCTM